MQMELAKTLRNYDRKNLSKDILTGLIIMAVSIPISMGYARLQGFRRFMDCTALYSRSYCLGCFPHHLSSSSGWMQHQRR